MMRKTPRTETLTTERGVAAAARPVRRRAAPRMLALLTLLVLAPLLSKCAGPNTSHCENDADCPDGSRGHAYCVESRCVECVTNSACGAHHRCSHGECVEN